MTFKLKWNNTDENKVQMINLTAHLSYVVHLYLSSGSGNTFHKWTDITSPYAITISTQLKYCLKAIIYTTMNTPTYTTLIFLSCCSSFDSKVFFNVSFSMVVSSSCCSRSFTLLSKIKITVFSVKFCISFVWVVLSFNFCNME